MTNNILGAYSGHDAGAALLSGGALQVAIEKERLTREKHASGNCRVAVDYCLRAGGLRLEEVDYIATSKGTVRQADPEQQQVGRLLGVEWDQLYSVDQPYAIHRMELDGHTFPTYCVQHHICHCASSFLLSPFEEAAILSIDGGGDFTATMLAVGRGKSIEVRERPGIRLGASYRKVAHRLGFPRIPSSPGRVMALAAYGEPVYYDAIMRAARGPDEFSLDSDSATRLFGWRNGNDLESEESANIAASIQLAVEEVILALCRRLHELTKLDSICLAGGVALNCLANRRILEETPFERLFIPPVCNDTGIALGAALYTWNHVLGEERLSPLESASLGRAYSQQEVLQAIRRVDGVIGERCENMPARLAAELAEGAVVGWFQGGSEVGPRALGHRSLLADPRPATMKDRLNREVKRRERFRPFAPAVLEECSAEYFDYSGSSPFMLLTAQVKPWARDLVPGTLHVDGSARLQTVNRRTNAPFFDLISAFRDLTGVPMLLNTSFNAQGMPIVESPTDAIECFVRNPIDLLAVGPYLVRRC